MEDNNSMPTFKQVFKKEWYEETIKNRKRIIKFIVICIVPFLYGFFCIWAFWNPFSKTDQIPMAILNNDSNLCVVYKPKDNTHQSIANGTDIRYLNAPDASTCVQQQQAGETSYFTSVSDNVVTGPKYYDKDSNSVKIEVSSVTLKLNYLKNDKTNFNPIDKYWVQLRIPENYSRHIINILRNIAGPTFDQSQFLTDINWIANNQVNIWSTYKQNFLVGYFATDFTNLRQSFVQNTIPQLILPMLYSVLSNPDGTVSRITYENYINNINTTNLTTEVDTLVQQGQLTSGQGKAINTFLRLFGTIKSQIIPIVFGTQTSLSHDQYFTNTDRLGSLLEQIGNVIDIPYYVQGYEYNEYGIGLGELFILIGVWVGALTQTFVYDRKGRTKNARSYQHYFSKLLLMLCTSWIQVTILMASLLILGFGQIGAVYALLWLWMLFMGTVFNIIICSIWLVIPDEMLGRFVAVIYLIINLSAGWGTFPSFMQNKFFDILSYIAPFKYGLHNIGTIIYGLSSLTLHVGIGQYQTEIIKNIGILLIWVIIFGLLGLVGTYYRFRKMRYGTINLKLIFTVMDNIIEVKKYEKNISTLNYLTKTEQELIKKEVIIQLNKKKEKHK